MINFKDKDIGANIMFFLPRSKYDTLISVTAVIELYGKV